MKSSDTNTKLAINNVSHSVFPPPAQPKQNTVLYGGSAPSGSLWVSAGVPRNPVG